MPGAKCPVPFKKFLKGFFMTDADHAFDKFDLNELIELLVEKTTEYLGMAKQRDPDVIELRNLKTELDNLHSMIALRKSFNNSVFPP